MNAIFVNTQDGIIKADVIYNPFWKKFQLYIDGSLYGEYNEEEIAIEDRDKSFSEENIIKPDCTLLISTESPLSNQCKAIAGDSYNTGDFEDLYKTTLIKHRKTGLVIRTISKSEIREHLADYPKKENK
ncbi:hypothetical protein CLV62_104101 [Dysgonomonas alginatilytica]|uniref:Uncharacterized protein n=1 Tax=Dysgonomonas alginatilytica TaxID=1605892 RepID=A0A2V3PR80_9BACT|nr:hypothetical protein [Dysgonomonas alginatilytica]PXV66840.1 hypothetical protein CLV62_104101 [Dysgonomonas alginatilytica]